MCVCVCVCVCVYRNELVTFICDALEHLERENYINRTAGLQAPTEPQQAETVEATGEEQL